MRVAWLNNREFHTQFPPKKLNDWRERRTLILVKRTVDDGFTPKRWCEARNACLIGGPTGNVLPPCDQIVERVNVWRKAEDDPTDGAPKNNSVTHRLPPLD